MLFWSCFNLRSICKVSSSRLAKVAEEGTATVELVFSRDGKHGAAIMNSSSENVEEELQRCPAASMELRGILGRNHYTLVNERLAIASGIPIGENLQVVTTCSVEDVKIDRSFSFCYRLEDLGNKLYALVQSSRGSASCTCIHEISEAGNFRRVMFKLHTEMFALTNDSILVYCLGNCQVWDKDLSKLIWTWNCDPRNKVLCAANDIVVFMVHKTGCVSLHDVQTGNLKWTLEEGAGCGWIDPDNSRLLTATSEAVKLWDLSAQTCLKCHELRIRDCSVASGKQLVAVLLHHGFAVRVLSEMSGEVMKQINVCSAMLISFVHGTHLAYLTSAAVHLVDIEKSEKVAIVRLRKAGTSFGARLCYNQISRSLALARGDEFSLFKVNYPNL